MRWLLRPILLWGTSAALVASGAFFLFPGGRNQAPPQPLPVEAGDHEIVWLYGATNAAPWERFVAAVARCAERLQPELGIKAVIGPQAFPHQTDAVPEIVLQWPGGRLVFRWYKLTSDWKTHDWVEALLQRPRPPLAIIGGSSSEAARELALQMQLLGAELDEERRPVLVLTTATADNVREDDGAEDSAQSPSEVGLAGEEGGGVRLSRIYAGRTFRFCFTNRQMAVALTHFLWRRDDLRPDADPVYLVRWEDDIYSCDLIDGFWRALRGLVAEETAAELAWVSSCLAAKPCPLAPLAGGVLPLARTGSQASGFRMNRLPTPQAIDSSVGTFHAPNRFEAQAARYLLLDLDRESAPRRPLLVVTGQAAPTRRFLRALARTAPIQARRFVVATGDALAFNVIYRDRRVAWPVQDLPFDLVLFCHHNPIDTAAGFRPDVDVPSGSPEEGLSAATGTEDLLLFADIVEALARAVRKDGQTATGPAMLAGRLNELRVTDDRFGFDGGGPLFTPHGNRRGGTGEHVVSLRPRFEGDRVLPRATIEVWTWRTAPDGGRAWLRVGEPLPVTYDEGPAEGGGR